MMDGFLQLVKDMRAAERQELANDPDCIRMANGQTLRQGNLFED